ncbi:MAG: hypothetical protein U9Q00_11860 [Synergistota bacterium]|nr:hypothetical protein [Synergistota bacterium]
MDKKEASMTSIAMQSMFDLDATVACEHMDEVMVSLINPETKKVRIRDVSIEEAFRNVGRYIREGMAEFDQDHPRIAKKVRQHCVAR